MAKATASDNVAKEDRLAEFQAYLIEIKGNVDALKRDVVQLSDEQIEAL
jgi:hypothetical protein